MGHVTPAVEVSSCFAHICQIIAPRCTQENRSADMQIHEQPVSESGVRDPLIWGCYSLFTRVRHVDPVSGPGGLVVFTGAISSGGDHSGQALHRNLKVHLLLYMLACTQGHCTHVTGCLLLEIVLSIAI